MSVDEKTRLRLATSASIDELLPILRAADEGDERILATLHNDKYITYAARDGEQLIGAATVCWQPESEIEYIAVAEKVRGCGYGKAIIRLLFAEARQRGVRSLLVGTANSSLENIAFYQKCGFRIDHVRRDYFNYIQPPISENGIVMRDMIVLRSDIEDRA